MRPSREFIRRRNGHESAWSFSLIQQKQTASGDFLLTFTGGTGSGLFFPSLDLVGGTNESHGTFGYLGGKASLTGFAIPFMTTGNLMDSVIETSDVSFTCAGNIACYLPFTYGQSQVVHLVGTATAAIQANLRATDPGAISASASVNFTGIQLLTLDGRPAPAPAIGAVTQLPEPGSGSLVLGSLISAVVLRRKRRLS